MTLPCARCPCLHLNSRPLFNSTGRRAARASSTARARACADAPSFAPSCCCRITAAAASPSPMVPARARHSACARACGVDQKAPTLHITLSKPAGTRCCRLLHLPSRPCRAALPPLALGDDAQLCPHATAVAAVGEESGEARQAFDRASREGRAAGLGFGVWGLGFGVWGLGPASPHAPAAHLLTVPRPSKGFRV